MKKLAYTIGSVSVLFLLIIPLFGYGVPDTHDAEANIARFAAFYTAIADGHIPPRWAGNLNYGYGSAVLSFFYPLTGYLGSFLHIVGFSFEQSFSMLVVISVVASVFSFYFWTKKLFVSYIALLIGIVYAFVPYQLLNIYVRGDVGELIAYAIVPIVFGSIERIRKKPDMWFVLIGAVSYGLLILSHNIVSLLMTPVLLGYVFVRVRNKKSLIASAIMFCIGLLLSFYFWFPALYEQKYTLGSTFIGDMFSRSFLKPFALIYSQWGYGAQVGVSGGQAPMIGIVLTFFLIISVYVFYKRKNKRSDVFYWYVIFTIATYMTLAISKPLWDILPLIAMIQFPWRFLSVASLSAVVLSGFMFDYFGKISSYIPFVLLGVFLIGNISLARVQKFVSHTDKYYLDYSGTTYFHGQTTPIWTAGDPSEYPVSPVEIIEGTAQVTKYTKISNSHTFNIYADTDARILDNTVYFPGWRVFVDGQETGIEFQDIEYRGLITFDILAGAHSVEVRYTETKTRLLADMVSMVAFIIVSGLVIYNTFKKLKQIKK